MKKIVMIIFILMFCISVAFATECSPVPTNGCIITQNTVFVPDIYPLPNGISIMADNVELDCNGAVLMGNYIFVPGGFPPFPSIGIMSYNPGVTIKNCKITQYTSGMILKEAVNLNIIDNELYGNMEAISLSAPSSIGYEGHNNVAGNEIHENNRGISLTSLGDTVKNNNLYDNTYANLLVSIKTASPVNIDNNWWGSTISSEIAESIIDCEEYSEGACADYDPWLCAPYPSTDVTSCRNQEVPEFTVVGSILALLGCAGIIFIMRKKTGIKNK